MPKSSSYQDRARLRLTRTPEFYLKFIAAHPFEILLPSGALLRLAHLDSETVTALHSLLIVATP